MIRNASLFSQVLQLISRNNFQREVNELKAERHAKGFTCWDQLVAMLFCQLAGANSLREIEGGLACAAGKLKHLGMSKAPVHSTLSYANQHRPWELYQRLFYQLLDHARHVAGRHGHRFRFKNPLMSIDASVIQLCANSCDWARYCRAKGAVKLHLQLDHRGYLPVWAAVTAGNVHEVNLLKDRSFEPGTIVVFDRGYVDYGLFNRFCEEGVYFVTREKKNMRSEIDEIRQTPERGNVLLDQVVKLKGKAADQCPHRLRRIMIRDEEQGLLTFLTNHLDFGPTTIADIYKDRWQIEAFFKALKQNLQIKSFVGTSFNAIATQIWTALIAILMLKLMQMRSKHGWSLSNLTVMFRMNILVYRDLWQWLDDPYNKPPPPAMIQLELFDTSSRTASGPRGQ